MRFVTDLSKGILGSTDSTELWTDILSHIPDEILLKPGVRILNVACGQGTEAVILAKRMLALGISKEAVNKSMYLLDKYHVFTGYAKSKYGFKNVITEDFATWETDMKFDVVIGNPPYQDGSKEGGQNKIYNQFCKKALLLANNTTGIVAFVTPTSVLKKSKRFSLINQQGLKLVNFTADNYFSVGANICCWIVNRKYTGEVSVIHNNGVDTQPNNSAIYNYSVVDREFTELYKELKKATSIPKNRMFKHNAVDMTLGRGRTKEKTKGFEYPVYTINSDNTVTFVQYNKSRPKLHGKKQLVIPISKTFNEKFATVDTRDFDMKHLATSIDNNTEVTNIKSFIFSDYFRSHVAKWKEVDGYGWNYALMYLPLFDKTKVWTNNEVKEFLESFVK